MAAGRPLSSCKVPNCQEKFQGFSGTHVGFFLFLMLFSFFLCLLELKQHEKQPFLLLTLAPRAAGLFSRHMTAGAWK